MRQPLSPARPPEGGDAFDSHLCLLRQNPISFHRDAMDMLYSLCSNQCLFLSLHSKILAFQTMP